MARESAAQKLNILRVNEDRISPTQAFTKRKLSCAAESGANEATSKFLGKIEK